MNLSSTKEELSEDPFAADIFAARRSEIDTMPETPPEIDSENANHWSEQLPKIAPSAVAWDDLHRNLPAEFCDEMPRRLAESLTRLLNLSDAQTIAQTIEFAFLTQREINRAEDFEPSENVWRLTAGIEASEAEICFEIEDAFAAWLVDQMLGGTTSGGGQIRNLTESEQAVLEFASLNLTIEANRITNAPLFKFRALSREFPASLSAYLDSEKPSMLVVSWQINSESLPGIVKMYLAPEALRALQTNENRLLDVRPRRRATRQNLRSRIKNARMRLRLGNAELSFAELAALERNDVVLLENHELIVGGSEVSGSAEIFLGDGENVKIVGEFTSGDFATNETIEENAESADNKINENKILVRRLNSKSEWQIVIESFEETENPRLLTKKSMTETDDDYTNEFAEENAEENANEQAGLAIENLAVTLRVELEARRLGLTEIENLRENQILELGVRPTDAVNLLIDNQIIGRGELVAVEDRLGVRITKLLR